LLAEADIKGRVCPDKDVLLAKIDLFRDTGFELNCFTTPFSFPSNHSRYLYFQKEGRSPIYKAYDNTKFEVMLMSGLPGAGKDYWIKENVSGYPTISLDDIRTELKISPKKKQHKVINKAKEQAKAYLRQQQSFVWNATNITRSLRSRLIQMFAGYKARVKIVYVEPKYSKLIKQNNNRYDCVPENVMNDMLRRLEIPLIFEAHEVIYAVS